MWNLKTLPNGQRFIVSGELFCLGREWSKQVRQAFRGGAVREIAVRVEQIAGTWV